MSHEAKANPRGHRAQARLGLVLAAWGCTLLAGFGVLANYSRTPGDSRQAMAQWPEHSALARAQRATLVLFLHPHCPCSNASLEEFNRILARAPSSFDSWIVFVRPVGVAEGWEVGELWTQAKRLPGVNIFLDVDAVEAKHFGAATSGMVFVYDDEERLLFSGGITGQRGHSGDNAGTDGVMASLSTPSRQRLNAPVFGCPLFD